ncbi:hypothetical protein [Lewinella sp. IMCC34183]|uniref:hypothetical protein n=1 Tax=Lewinella sp. IMCC34183 TaxID=2248762 RepID=UPI000E222469|nr:hypothetical protein [Lewinella sp. IMCC34183]
MLKYVILTGCLCTLFTCEKDLTYDIGDNTIRGRAFLQTDYFREAQPAPAAGKMVTITYLNPPAGWPTTDAGDNEVEDYLFSTKTDGEGYFSFDLLREDHEYVITYEELINGRRYVGRDTSKPEIYAAAVTATLALTGQTGIQILSFDEAGAPLKGVKHCLYRTEDNLPSDPTDCSGSNLETISDDRGYAMLLGSPETYLLRSSLKIGNNVLADSTQLTFEDQKVITQPVYLSLQTAAVKNSVRFQTYDVRGDRLPGVQLCLFTSQLLFERDSCAGSNFQFLTDGSGTADTTDLPANFYYLHGEKIVGNQRWTVKSAVNFAAGEDITISLKLE